MPKDRFFLDTHFEQGDTAVLADQEFHHLAHVMRGKPGEIIELVNGKGTLATAQIEKITRQKAEFLVQVVENKPLSKRKKILAQCIPKLSRLTWIIEKGTELGVTEFLLIGSERCKEKLLSKSKLEKLKGVSISALKQSGRLYLPRICVSSTLLDWVPPELSLYFGDLAEDAPLLSREEEEEGFVFVTGPEAGFSSEEVEYLRKVGGKGVKLHDNVLRTDTASVVALSLLS